MGGSVENNQKDSSSQKDTKKKQPSQFSKNTKKKVNSLKKKSKIAYSDFKKWLVNKEVYVKGKEPPKSYLGKKFYGLFILFIFYSFLIIFNINTGEDQVLQFQIFQLLTFGNPFAFGIALVLFYLTISVLFSVDKFREFMFEKNTVIKQVSVFSGIIAGFFLLFIYVDTSLQLNYMSFLLLLALAWLLLQSSRFYTYSRKFSTKIESKIVAKYSILRNFAIFLIPFIIVGFLVIISWYFRSFIVFFALDMLGPFNPSGAMDVYQIEMRRIMPLIYTSLIITITFIVLEFFLTRKRGETRRAGLFDNLTFSLIVFFIFFYQVYQVTLYTFLRPETTGALKDAFGGQSNVMGYMFIIEFLVSIVFLLRVLLKIGSTLGWRVLFFKKDGLIMFFIACVFAQTLSRFGVSANVPNQEIGGFSELLMHDRFLISIIMIILLGLTLLIYYIKPHETSLFMRIQKEIVKEEEKSMETILKILRNEFIRRGEAFPIQDIELELIKTSKLSKGIVYSLIGKLDDKMIEFRVIKKTEEDETERRYADFLSITGKYEKKGVAEKKAKTFLTEKFSESMAKAPQRSLKTRKLKLDEEKASDKFLLTLSKDIGKKRREEISHDEAVKETFVSFTAEHVDETVEERIIRIIKKEYVYRIENSDTYPNYKLPISEIAPAIGRETKISSGVLYPMLEELSKTNLELNLHDNPDDKEDKIISFTPHWDFELDYLLINYKPEDYSEIVISNYKKLIPRLTKTNQIFLIKKVFSEINEENELQKSFKALYKNLINSYAEFEKELKRVPDDAKLIKSIKKWGDFVEKRRKELGAAEV